MSSAAPTQPLQEGSRWRHAKPSGEEVAAWFSQQPIDEDMAHDDYVSGVVVIKAVEKIKVRKPDGRGFEEKFEDVYTPYVRVDTRVNYFRKLAELRDLVAVIEPVAVPRIEPSEGQLAYKNDHMPLGFWWHVAGSGNDAVRSLCCTMRVALYRREDWFPEVKEVRLAPEDVAGDLPIELIAPRPRPLREGRATKQVTGAPDPNGLAKAETGAIGRALGVAGILVIGTGIATAEDMQDYTTREAPSLPQAGAAEETEEALNERLINLQGRLKGHEPQWQAFVAWWDERAREAGWANVMQAPIEVRRGMAAKMEGLVQEALAEQRDTSPRPQPLPTDAPRPAPASVLP